MYELSKVQFRPGRQGHIPMLGWGTVEIIILKSPPSFGTFEWGSWKVGNSKWSHLWTRVYLKFPALKISSFFNMKKEGISKFYPIINNPENRLYVGTMAV